MGSVDVLLAGLSEAAARIVDPAYTETFRQSLEFDSFRIGLSYRF